MPSLTLTKATVARLAPTPGRQVIYWDTALPGFGVLVSGKTNARSFVAQGTLPGGSTRRVTIAPVARLDLAAARDAARDLLYQMGKGIDPKRQNVEASAALTLRGALDGYIGMRRDRDRPLRPASQRLYRGLTERCLAAWLDRPLRDITPDMVEKRLGQIATEAGKPTANTAMRIFGILHEWARSREPLPPNPVLRLKGQWFKVASRTRRVEDDELPGFYAAVQSLPNPVHRDYITLMLFTGLRRSEAASLRWEDLDFRARTFRIPPERTKADRALVLPMTDIVHALFMERQRLGRDGPFVFPSANRAKHITSTQGPLAAVAAACGVTVSAHDLRRTYVTVAEATNLAPYALKALVNHALPEDDVTAGYVQMTAERLREPAQRVCDRLKELCGITGVEGANVARLGA